MSEAFLFERCRPGVVDAEIPTSEDFVDEIKLEVSAAFDEVDAIRGGDFDGDDDEVDEKVQTDGQDVEDGHSVISKSGHVNRLVCVMTVVKRGTSEVAFACFNDEFQMWGMQDVTSGS